MQTDNEKMLQEIVQNTEMGKNTLDELMGLTHDQKLKDEMMRQKREYRRFNQAAHTALDAIGAEAHGQSAAARMSVSMGIRTRTMMDKSTRNLATMLAEGSGQGVLDCKRAEKDYPTASPGAMQLCHELGCFQSEAEQTWRGCVYTAVPLLGEGGRRPDEGRACRYNPFMGNNGKPAPHQSASQTASPSGEASLLTISDRPL